MIGEIDGRAAHDWHHRDIPKRCEHLGTIRRPSSPSRGDQIKWDGRSVVVHENSDASWWTTDVARATSLDQFNKGDLLAGELRRRRPLRRGIRIDVEGGKQNQCHYETALHVAA